jgi:EpsI family protein
MVPPIVIRLFAAAAMLLAMYGGARFVHDHGIPTEPAPLVMKPQDLPLLLGEWKGEAVDLDPAVFEATGAAAATNRLYRDRYGHVVSLHMAVFDRLLYGATGAPHLPENCYRVNGWQILEPKLLPLDQNGDMAKLQPAQRHGENVWVLYWYQIDGRAYYNGDQQRRIVQGWRGRAQRPAIVKVMLQTTAAKADEAEKALKSLAAEVYKWTKDYH